VTSATGGQALRRAPHRDKPAGPVPRLPRDFECGARLAEDQKTVTTFAARVRPGSVTFFVVEPE
jgi:hypothetical protein